jgi:hypothetical protein
MKETLTIRLSEELAEALEEEARESGRSKGEIAREALASNLKKKKQLTVMRRYFGTVSGPSDLSTNKAYRRAWRKPA